MVKLELAGKSQALLGFMFSNEASKRGFWATSQVFQLENMVISLGYCQWCAIGMDKRTQRVSEISIEIERETNKEKQNMVFCYGN